MATTKQRPDRQVVSDTARVLKCLGHPLRLMILDQLDRHGEQTVSEIQEALGLEQATTSQHLTLLRDKGVLARRKDGVNVFYSIADDRAIKVLSCIRSS